MASPTAQCIKRLQMELRRLAIEKDTTYQIGADPQNILRCYFIIDGPEGTPYEGGRYVGLLGIPPDYPFKPPSVKLCTPSGRFKTGVEICLSNSSYHPEQWSPMWGLRTILIALVSFFVSDEATTGSMESSVEDKRKCAANSRQYNVEHIKAVYKRVLPEAYAKDVAYLERERQVAEQALMKTKAPHSDSNSENESSDVEENEGESCATSAAKSGLQNSASGDAENDAKDATSANGDGSEVAAAGEKLHNAGVPIQKHRHHHRHDKFARVEQVDKVWPLVGVPWRRWVSLAVLVAVGLVLVEQLRW
ncbi:putative Ubiquitin-conjugating enzyme E2 [Leptomonas seymouri]|uniref:Putative Ubiquitin-conjugating enzyme E2 n=1 Tax=Leptomonas seymouri TaxID=5684 RepID=C6K3V1_LEPSE|nr:putative Ubiquitin-conjugating enzyme E2 [Leptomonas seymouri]KPI85589.1 putative Ubiquitin-conjugating enzyme E2 [Leptomonas seymouri]|eukprot:KPI85589.1 putative Ubiquitin-conjugating enzyme E2 [Leptomonas seymouri]